MKVGIVGSGMVGSTTGYALGMRGGELLRDQFGVILRMRLASDARTDKKRNATLLSE